MNLFTLVLLISTLLVNLVAGLLLTFAIIIMPGMATLSDRAYLIAFKVIDRIIQNGQIVFMIVWLGSIIGLIASIALGWSRAPNLDRTLLLSALVIYVGGVMLPTMRFNVPANNRLQALDLSAMDDAAIQSERIRFEPNWVRWNHYRTIAAILTSVIVLTVLLRQ